jgi:hypothetical protein
MHKEILKAIESGPTSYISYLIPKSNGGIRRICEPNKDLKQIQIQLTTCFKLKISNHAVAYRFDKYIPPKEYLKEHSKYEHTVSLDLKNFFRSIHKKDIIHSFSKNGYSFNHKQSKLLTHIVFKKGEKGIPMGSCCSPWLSNVVMHEFDVLLNKKLNDSSIDLYWSRYSDNIYISCNDFQDARRLRSIAVKHIYKSTTPRLRVNKNKTYINRTGEARKILGIYLTADKKFAIGRIKKKAIGNLLYQHFKYGSLDQKDLKTLLGYLSFAKYYDEVYWSRIDLKYGRNLIQDLCTLIISKHSISEDRKKLNPELIESFLRTEFDIPPALS